MAARTTAASSGACCARNAHPPLRSSCGGAPSRPCSRRGLRRCRRCRRRRRRPRRRVYRRRWWCSAGRGAAARRVSRSTRCSRATSSCSRWRRRGARTSGMKARPVPHARADPKSQVSRPAVPPQTSSVGTMWMLARRPTARGTSRATTAAVRAAAAWSAAATASAMAAPPASTGTQAAAEPAAHTGPCVRVQSVISRRRRLQGTRSGLGWRS